MRREQSNAFNEQGIPTVLNKKTEVNIQTIEIAAETVLGSADKEVQWLTSRKKSERKFKITVCNGYKVNGQKRMKAQTITVPSSVPKRGIQQYVMAEAERIEKKFKYGVEESDQTHFEQYAENWLKRQKPFFKATTYVGYKRNLGIVYPLIGGIPLAKLLPMTLEEMCEELRKRPGRGGKCIKETTVQKYLENSFLGTGGCQEK